MDCNERQDLILLYAAGALEPAERDQLRAHLETGCPGCAGALAEAQAVIAQLPLALDKVKPAAEVKDRLMVKIAGSRRGLSYADKSVRIGKSRDWNRIVIPGSLAALLLVAVILAAMYRLRNTLDQRDATIAQLNKLFNGASATNVEQTLQIAALEKQIEGMDSMKIARLTGDAQPDALGRVFVDLKKNKWYFFTSGMKPTAEGKTYELWLVADSNKIPAGSFKVGNDGVAQLLGTVPSLANVKKVSMAVSEEKADTPPAAAPGSIQIGGDLKD